MLEYLWKSIKSEHIFKKCSFEVQDLLINDESDESFGDLSFSYDDINIWIRFPIFYSRKSIDGIYSLTDWIIPVSCSDIMIKDISTVFISSDFSIVDD